MNAQRLERLDALRGLAMVWMTAYHLCFDLNHFGFIQQNFYADPFWTLQRSAIVSLFVGCAGLSQAVALQQGQGWAGFWRRWGQVALCALLVSAGSYLMFPGSWIYFGVLHGIALMLIVLRLTVHWGAGLWLAGAAALALGAVGADALAWCAGEQWLPLFNSRALNWLGIITQKPVTEDYVPLLPWLGVMWWGLAAGQWLTRRAPDWLAGGVGPARPLARLGRWSLGYYMLHQPVLIGLLGLLVWLR